MSSDGSSTNQVTEPAAALPPSEETSAEELTPEVGADPSQNPPFTHTRISGYWAAIVVSLVVLVIFIVFLLENGQRAKVSFFGVHGHLPQGVALLLAAVIGGLVVAVAGIARVLQLRSRARKSNGTNAHRRFRRASRKRPAKQPAA